MTLDDLIRITALPRHEIVQLAVFATGRNRTSLLAHSDRALSSDELPLLREHLARRLTGVPIAYLVGRRDFYGRAFMVDRRVLIPRAETELIVDLALAHCDAAAADAPATRVLDVGTGSGVIAITLALERSGLDVSASDVSPEALAVGATNARALGATVRFVESDWYDAFLEGSGVSERFDVIVSNPPYIAADDRHLREGDLRFEPRDALTDGRDGLDAIRRVVGGAKHHLTPTGRLFVEHGHDQARAVRALLGEAGFVDVRSCRDLAGIERVAHAIVRSQDDSRCS